MPSVHPGHDHSRAHCGGRQFGDHRDDAPSHLITVLLDQKRQAKGERRAGKAGGGLSKLLKKTTGGKGQQGRVGVFDPSGSPRYERKKSRSKTTQSENT